MTLRPANLPQFYLTEPSPCPYLPDQQERKIFTQLVGEHAPELNNILTKGGFRRSQSIAYRPACSSCKACVSVRVVVDKFKPSKNLKRVSSINHDIASIETPAWPTTEQYTVFRDYIESRHPNGGMYGMSVYDYAMMVEDTHVNSIMVEYRQQEPQPKDAMERNGKLVATALTDYLSDGLSMIYSFFDTTMTDRSLGTYMILDHIERAKRNNLPYLYLGYWISGSPQMDYKIRFQPLEYLGETDWESFVPET